MKRSSLLVLLCVMAWAAVMAVPAKRGTRVFTQTDGTKIHLELTGDEWHHSYVTSEGLAVSRAADGNFYYRTTDGVSKVMAHDAGQRSAAEAQFITTNQAKMSMQSLFTPAQQARRAANNVARKATQVPNNGAPHVPVVLVQYKDKKFIDSDPKAAWEKQISGANEVSVYQYFVDQSFGKYTPQFDILGPVTLANNRSTYGGNDYSGNDKGVGKMVAEGCQGVSTSVDWSKYDNDGDGVVDVVIVLYAGDGEASSYDSDAANSVWPCQWDLSSSDYGRNITLDGVTISKFAVFNEANGEDLTKIDGIGTFCHEFSHCLGLPDFYETTYNNGYFGMNAWSLMDYGSYNNGGYTPCGYIAYERDFMGWIKLTEPKEGKTYTERSVANGGTAYKITTPNSNEYFVIETIEQNGWDEYARSRGLLVNHVTYRESYWTNNTVNNYSTQCMTILPADNAFQKETIYSGGQSYTRYSDDGLAGDLYPYNGNDEITATSAPAFKMNLSSGNLDKPVTGITKNSDGSVTYTYVAGAVDTPVASEATDITGNSAVAHWAACEGAESYTLKVNPYVAPTYELALEETFVKCTTPNTRNQGSNLNSYMDHTGWTGSTVYIYAGGIRLGSSTSTGYVTSPSISLSNTGGKATVVIKGRAYNNDTNCSLKVTLGDEAQTVVFANSNYETKTLVFNCAESANATLKLENTTNRRRVEIGNIKVYSGDASQAANAPARSEFITYEQDGGMTITGITDTQYNIVGLSPLTEYTYTVKAIYAEQESQWSNLIHFTTTERVELVGDVNMDGVVDVEDINIIVNCILGTGDTSNYRPRADVNGDQTIDVEDINAVVNIILGGNN